MSPSRVRLALISCAATCLLSAPAPTGAQIPDEFTNLKLLDPEIQKRELVGIMRGWAQSLGVRCNHCHVGPDNLVGMDFASDEKQTKRAARVMLEMTRVVNGQFVGRWDEGGEGETPERQTVSCFTCHRGQSKPPQKLAWVLAQTALSDGVDAALARYRELRAEYEDAGVYDFRAGTFTDLAQAAFEAGRLDAALEVLRGGLEIHPQSADIRVFLGMALLQAGDADGAAASFDEAEKIDPDHPGIPHGRAMLERTRTPPDDG
ncbi:MAG: c-type cytochrome [Thermoanaerobaculia bacterium]|nr:c-type cytochrome [Thermoanaerobaculia bacterium]